MGIASGLKRVKRRVGDKDGWVIVGVGAGSEGWNFVKQRTGMLGGGSMRVCGTGSVLKVGEPASSCGVLGRSLGGVCRPVG